jgi:hypothetical protein
VTRVHWTFNDIDGLHDALHGYGAFLDCILTGSYGERRYGADGGDDEKYERAVSKRAEIDACMDGLKDTRSRLVLDQYFRHSRCDEASGWREVAKSLGMKARKKEVVDWFAFKNLVVRAVGELWSVHVERREDAE